MFTFNLFLVFFISVLFSLSFLIQYVNYHFQFYKNLDKKIFFLAKQFLLAVFYFNYMVSSMLLQISCSTVVHTLDHITQEDSLAIDSLSKKKKQKKNSQSCLEEDVNGGELLRGEKALSFIASLLDMLLLKKDLVHRSLEFIYAYICLSVNFGNWRRFIAHLIFLYLILA